MKTARIGRLRTLRRNMAEASGDRAGVGMPRTHFQLQVSQRNRLTRKRAARGSRSWLKAFARVLRWAR